MGKMKRTARKHTRATRALLLPEPTPHERVHWLLGFLRADVGGLRPGDWLNLRHDVQRHLWPQSTLGEPDFNGVMAALHAEARRGLDTLYRERGWTLDPPITRSVTRVEVQGDGAALLVHERLPLQQAVRSAAVDLIATWWHELRRCRECGAWFLPRHGRQQFHDAGCASRARWKKFAPKRSRDYAREYKQRLGRAHGPGVKIRIKSRHRTTEASR